MGLFLEVMLFPGGEVEQCRQAFVKCPQIPEMNVRPVDCSWAQYAGGAAVLLNDGAVGYDMPAPLSAMLTCPIMLLYIYDDDYWGYHLWQQGAELDYFASLPDYFEPGEPPAKPGDASALARCFGVEPAKIVRYLEPWDNEQMGQFAYPDDEFVIGDCWQLADFMAALGFAYDKLVPSPADTDLADLAAESAPNEESDFAPYLDNKCLPIDTPILPDVLNDREYALRRALELPPIYADICQLLQNGLYADMLPLLTAAIQKTPREPVLYLLRAFCYSQLECLTCGRSRRPDMDRDLTKVLEFEPDNIWALRAHCPTTATTSRYPRHIQDLTRLMEIDPDYISIHQVSRAYRYHWLGDDEAAKADLLAVLERGDCWTVDLTYLCQEFALPGF